MNIVQLRIKHEIEKQVKLTLKRHKNNLNLKDLITRLERESERNSVVCDTYVKSTNTLKDMIGTLKKTGKNRKLDRKLGFM